MELLPPFAEYEHDFEVLNLDEPLRHRRVRSPIAPELLGQVDDDGFVILRRFVPELLVAELSAIVDEVRGRLFGGSAEDSYSSGRFGGQYVRDLHAYSAEAWDLLLASGIPDLVRSLLGPRVVLRSYSVRVTHPGSESSTVWHADQRARVSPVPPWFSEPHSTTVLVYLDRADEVSGRTVLVQGSHRHPGLPPEDGSHPAIDSGEVPILGEPGDTIAFNGALWHRAEATGCAATPRRVLNLQFAPSWAKRAAFGDEVADPAWAPAAEAARAEGRSDVLELLGLGGYM